MRKIGLCNGVRLKSDRSLGQQSAIGRPLVGALVFRAVIVLGRIVPSKCGRSNGGPGRGLPEDILDLRAATQDQHW
jgi:hypothetical protein